MDRKLTGYAGWLVFIPMLFLSVFYLLTTGFLTEDTTGIGSILCVGISVLIAFGGTRLCANFFRPMRGEVKLRPFRTSRVYTQFVLWVSLATALGVVFINLLISIFSSAPFWGLGGLYPMLAENIAVHPFWGLILLAILPAVVEELLLRGLVFPICETESTAAAVFYSALIMPLLYVYPQAAMGGLVIGAVCAILAYMTDSLWAAVSVHLCCRVALWLCDLAVRNEKVMAWSGIVVCILLFLFFICIYRVLRTYEGLMRDELIHPAKVGEPDAMLNLRNLFVTVGFGLFVLTALIRFIAMLVTYS